MRKEDILKSYRDLETDEGIDIIINLGSGVLLLFSLIHLIDYVLIVLHPGN